MTEVTNYLQRMSEIRRSGSAVKETSFYGALETLFNEVGKSLKPRVRCIINIQNRGAGIPDGGLFMPNQFQKQSSELIKGQLPERGCLEIKGTSEDVQKIARSSQVEKYLKTYRQVLVTNFDNLHGDRIISKVAPDGKASNTIFAVQGNSAGIKVGTSITTMVVNDSNQKPDREGGWKKDSTQNLSALANARASVSSAENHQVFYRGFTESNPQARRDALLASLDENTNEY